MEKTLPFATSRLHRNSFAWVLLANEDSMSLIFRGKRVLLKLSRGRRSLCTSLRLFSTVNFRATTVYELITRIIDRHNEH